jgi:hypothetical protein
MPELLALGDDAQWQPHMDEVCRDRAISYGQFTLWSLQYQQYNKDVPV